MNLQTKLRCCHLQPRRCRASVPLPLARPTACLSQSKVAIRPPGPRFTTDRLGHPLFKRGQVRMAASLAITEAPFEPSALPSVSSAAGDLLTWKGDLLVLGVFEEALSVTDDITSIADPQLKALDDALGGVVTDIIGMIEFKAKAGSTGTLRAGGSAKFLQLVGLGPVDKAKPVMDWGTSCFQSLGSAVASSAKTHKAKVVGVAFIASPEMSKDVQEAVATKVTVGALLGAYEPTRFKSKPSPTASKLEGLQLLGLVGAAVSAGVKEGEALARATLFARYLVEAPPNVATPSYLADSARHIAAAAPDVMSCEVFGYDACKEMGMGCYLGVADAAYFAGQEPQFIHLTYKPKGEVKKVVALVGKGVTFDSGGYNLKAGAGSMIEMMKFDMGGAASVLGAAKGLSLMKPPGVEVHVIVAACENMIDGMALHPGDILTAANGKTVEVLNTDAEGRLTLADAMWFAETKCGAEVMVDVATLTGAMIVSLGQAVAGYFTPSDELVARLGAAGKETGEKLWRLPLEESYGEQMKSSIADLRNIGAGRWGGAITAALFLKEFVSTDKIEWAHIDIAGTAWDDKQGGATGYGAMLLAKLVEQYGK